MAPSVWLAFALLAPMLWSVSNLIDEGLVRETPLRPWTIVMITGAFASTPTLLLATRWTWPGWQTAILAVCTGALSVTVYFPYFKALTMESAASVVLMWNLTPVIVLGLAATLIGEHVSPAAQIAVVLLVASSLTAAYRHQRKARWSSAFGWMVAASVLMAAESVMEKAIYQRTAFMTGLSWMALGSLLATTLVTTFASASRAHLRAVLSTGLGGLVLGNELLNLAAGWSLSFATSRGSVALVTAVGGLQPVFVLVFQALARRGRLTRPDLLRLVGASALAIGGLRLLHWST